MGGAERLREAGKLRALLFSSLPWEVDWSGRISHITRFKMASGHRGSFKPGCYKKSALAYHIFNDHPEVLSEGLNNFAFGVLKQVDPRFLPDAENLFIVQFKADTKHLNRYNL